MMISVSKWKSFVLSANGIVRERRDRVDAVAGVELAQRCARASGSGTSVRILLPTYLYSGMPPRSAAPGSIMREPKTASASPSAQRLDQIREALRRVLAVAVEQRDEVEPVASIA